VIPDDSNVNTKETEILHKYKDLEIKVSRMWKLRTKIVPVITGALGIFKKGLNQNLWLLLGHPLAESYRSHQLTLHTSFLRWCGKSLRITVVITGETHKCITLHSCSMTKF
jgi:hypothetical protein